MTYQNRGRGSYFEESQAQQYPQTPRYPGAANDEFSQFGGPQRAGPREGGGGEGWGQQQGTYQGGYQGGGYQGGGYQGGYQGGAGYQGGSSQGYGSQGYGSQGYGSQGYGSQGYGYQGRGYQGGPQYGEYGSSGQDYGRSYGGQGFGSSYGSQRGEAARAQPSGYPDYSSPQSYGPEGYGYQGQSGNYPSNQQERGNMSSGSREWGRSYAGYEGRGGAGYGGGYGSNYGSTFGGPAQRSGQGFGSEYGSGYGTSGYGGTRTEWGGGETAERRRQGPKGFQRSDDRLREQVVERLMETDIELRDVECNVKDGVVTLTGTVGSRRCRHEIENIADSVWGVKEVNNNVRVARDDQSGSFTEGKPGSERSSSGSSQRETTTTASQQDKHR